MRPDGCGNPLVELQQHLVYRACDYAMRKKAPRRFTSFLGDKKTTAVIQERQDDKKANEQIKQNLQFAKVELEETEAQLTMAAEFGKSLLEENMAIKDQLHDIEEAGSPRSDAADHGFDDVNESLKSMNTKLREQLSELKAENYSLHQAVTELDHKNSNLNSQVGELSPLRRQVVELGQRCKSHDESHERVETELRAKLEELAHAQCQVEKHKTELDRQGSMQGDLDEVHAENELLQARAAAAEEGLELSRRGAATATEQLAALEKEVHSGSTAQQEEASLRLEEKILKLQGEKRQLAEGLGEARQSVATLKAQADAQHAVRPTETRASRRCRWCRRCRRPHGLLPACRQPRMTHSRTHALTHSLSARPLSPPIAVAVARDQDKVVEGNQEEGQAGEGLHHRTLAVR
jgi:chromosome segregation ATPase